MENVKNMKIIAVDTSLGTNFLLSACEDATVSELRGMIQKEHMSCFPEHESINVGALLVDYNQRKYCVTDHLLVGQVFRKCWNKIHAIVSLGVPRAGFFSNDPKFIETKSVVDRKMEIPDGSLDKRPLVRHPEALLNAERNESSVDKQSSSDEAPSRLCQTKALDGNTGTEPARMVNQDCWVDLKKFRCHLFSIEAPYTQPFSELEVITKADATNEGHLDTKSKRKKRRYVEEERRVEMQKQGKVDCRVFCESAGDRESSPNKVNSSSTKEEPQAKIHEESHESLQPDIDQRDGLNGKVVLSKGEEHCANACEAPNDENIQCTRGLGNNMESGKGQGENLLSANAQAFVSSPRKTNLPAMILESHQNLLKRSTEEAGSCGVQKKDLESSWREKEFSYSKRKTKEFISEISGKTGTKECPETSAGNLQEGTEEANLNDGEQIHQLDLSMGYPIKINDHTVLLVASLSADVVPETQESQMESQDGINAGDEAAAVEPFHGCLKPEHRPLVDSVEPKETEAQVLPTYQDARNRSTQEFINQVEDLAVLADKVENSKLKPLVTDRPSKRLSPEETKEVTNVFDKHPDHETRLLDAKCSSDSHDFSVRGKTKKYRRRKVSEIDQVWKRKDDRLVGLNIEEQGVQGGVDHQKLMDENAQLTENLIETSNGKLETLNEVNVEESSYKVDINKGTSDDVNIRSRDPGSSRIESKERKVSRNGHRRKRKKQSVGSCNEISPFAGEHITEPKTVATIKARFRVEDGGECLEGSSIVGQSTSGQENLCNNDGEGKESDKMRRKKKKRRKDTSRAICDGDNGAGINNIHSNCEGAPVDDSVKNKGENDFRPSISKENKELPNALNLAVIEEGELNQGERNLNDNADCAQVPKKKSKRKKRVNTDTDLEMCFMQERDQNMNVNDTESLAKDDIIKSSSPVSPSKEPSQEDLVTIKQGFDVFEFEGSETVDRQKENCTHLEAVNNLEANNLDKLCSVAVNIVEDETLSPSKMVTRKTSRKPVHPKRWVTVLSERLTWNQTSKSSSKKQRADKKRGLKTKGTRAVEEMSSDGDIVNEASDAEEEAKEGSSQVIVDDGRIACSVGCGRLYTKKTSAYYRHCKKCSG